MLGMPKVLQRPLRQILTNCDEFRSQGQLYSIFIIDELSLWKNSLPEAESPNERVALTMSYLADKCTKSGESVQALFLRVLADAYDYVDERHELLAEELAETWQEILGVSTEEELYSSVKDYEKALELSEWLVENYGV
jgi:hypothetical protein